MDIRLGDVLRLKKGHPCGGNEWEVHRVGMDFRLQCRKCGRMIMVPRKQAEKNLRLLVRDGVSYKPMDLVPNRAAAEPAKTAETENAERVKSAAETETAERVTSAMETENEERANSAAETSGQK